MATNRFLTNRKLTRELVTLPVRKQHLHRFRQGEPMPNPAVVKERLTVVTYHRPIRKENPSGSMIPEGIAFPSAKPHTQQPEPVVDAGSLQSAEEGWTPWSGSYRNCKPPVPQKQTRDENSSPASQAHVEDTEAKQAPITP